MTAKYRVAVLVGSLRKESFNRKLALQMMALAPASLTLEIVEIGDLPLFNQDQENEPPTASAAFKAKIEAVDALLFATAEYNRSIPGVLKNALDVASRPYGKSAWNGKPGAVISASPGAAGGFGANHHLRQVLTALNVPTMPQPEAYIGGAAELFDEAGVIRKPDTRAFVEKFMTAFAVWIERNHAAA